MVTQKTGKEPSEEHEPMPGYSETYLGEVRDAFIDRLCGVPLLLHCRRAYSRAGERAGDERRTAGSKVKGDGRARPAGDIRFEHVSFAYRDKEVLQDVSIVFPRNTLTALFGASEVETALYE